MPFLLASTVLLTCEMAQGIVSSIRPSEFTDDVRTELIQTILDSSEKGCEIGTQMTEGTV